MSPFNSQKFIRIMILENAIEAQVVGSILNQYQIPHRVRSFYDTAYDGLFQVQKGWGELTAPESYRQEILDIVKDIQSASQD
ncbi:MAG: hypothetical protein JRF72_12605 [Deltaproteobacteria bacterium]|nr:hypothetical protein [Deltaproteobacteria bacterium]